MVTLTIFINKKEFPDGTFFRVAVEPEFKALSSMNTNNNRREILNIPVNMIQHGQILIHDGQEERVKSIFVRPQDTRTQFYFMHIYKTSGLSIKLNLLKRFANVNVYNNYIGLVDDDQMLNAKLVMGHFASYPVDLFKEHNIKLNTVTIVRDPVDRVISHYLYENRTKQEDWKESIEDFFNFLENNNNIKDLQTKNITSSLDKNSANNNAFNLFSTRNTLTHAFNNLGDTSRFLSNDTFEDKWEEHLGKFCLIGTMNNRDKFLNNMESLLNSENYIGPNFEEIYVNKNLISTSDFKKKLPSDLIDKIKELNQNDIALHEFLLKRGL